jgi:hypothetical protein
MLLILPNSRSPIRTGDLGSWAPHVSVTLSHCSNLHNLLISRPRTSYTFPYNYLVTTSSQLWTYRRRSTRCEEKLSQTFDALKASPLSGRDGRFVQNSRTCSPQLGWFAITGNSIFTHFKLQKAICTEKTFTYERHADALDLISSL